MSEKPTIGVIGCISTKDSPEAPPDQPNCEVQECDVCEGDIWVSSMKRKLKKENPLFMTMCMECAVLTMKVMEEDESCASKKVINITKEKF